MAEFLFQAIGGSLVCRREASNKRSPAEASRILVVVPGRQDGFSATARTTLPNLPLEESNTVSYGHFAG